MMRVYHAVLVCAMLSFCLETPAQTSGSQSQQSTGSPSTLTDSRRQQLYEKAWAAVQNYYPIVQQVSSQTGVDTILISAVITVESNGQVNSSSNKGAMGLMQLMPSTCSDFGVNDPFDPYQNIYGGSSLLAKLLLRYNGNIQKTLAAYNAGRRHVDDGTWQNIAETRAYVANVIDTMTAINGGHPVTDYGTPPPSTIQLLPPSTPAQPVVHWMDLTLDAVQNARSLADRELSENGTLDDAANTLLAETTSGKLSNDRISVRAANLLKAQSFAAKTVNAFYFTGPDVNALTAGLAKVGPLAADTVGVAHATVNGGQVWIVVLVSRS